MHDDFASLFAFNRWANAKMLDACRQLSPEQADTAGNVIADQED